MVELTHDGFILLRKQRLHGLTMSIIGLLQPVVDVVSARAMLACRVEGLIVFVLIG